MNSNHLEEHPVEGDPPKLVYYQDDAFAEGKRDPAASVGSNPPGSATQDSNPQAFDKIKISLKDLSRYSNFQQRAKQIIETTRSPSAERAEDQQKQSSNQFKNSFWPTKQAAQEPSEKNASFSFKQSDKPQSSSETQQAQDSRASQAAVEESRVEKPANKDAVANFGLDPASVIDSSIFPKSSPKFNAEAMGSMQFGSLGGPLSHLKNPHASPATEALNSSIQVYSNQQLNESKDSLNQPDTQRRNKHGFSPSFSGPLNDQTPGDLNPLVFPALPSESGRASEHWTSEHLYRKPKPNNNSGESFGGEPLTATIEQETISSNQSFALGLQSLQQKQQQAERSVATASVTPTKGVLEFKKKHNFVNWDTAGTTQGQPVLKSMPSLNTSQASIEGSNLQTAPQISERLDPSLQIKQSGSCTSDRVVRTTAESNLQLQQPQSIAINSEAATQEGGVDVAGLEIISERHSFQQEEESEVVSQNSDSNNAKTMHAFTNNFEKKLPDSQLSIGGGITVIDKGSSSIENSSMRQTGGLEDLRKPDDSSIVYNWSQETDTDFFKRETQSLQSHTQGSQAPLPTQNPSFAAPLEIPQTVLTEIYSHDSGPQQQPPGEGRPSCLSRVQKQMADEQLSQMLNKQFKMYVEKHKGPPKNSNPFKSRSSTKKTSSKHSQKKFRQTSPLQPKSSLFILQQNMNMFFQQPGDTPHHLATGPQGGGFTTPQQMASTLQFSHQQHFGGNTPQAQSTQSLPFHKEVRTVGKPRRLDPENVSCEREESETSASRKTRKRWDDLHALGKKRDQANQDKLLEQELRVMAAESKECTFSPSISMTSKQMAKMITQGSQDCISKIAARDLAAAKSKVNNREHSPSIDTFRSQRESCSTQENLYDWKEHHRAMALQKQKKISLKQSQDFYDRNMKWKMEKESLIHKQKAEKEVAQMKDSPFRPNLIQPSSAQNKKRCSKSPGRLIAIPPNSGRAGAHLGLQNMMAASLKSLTPSMNPNSTMVTVGSKARIAQEMHQIERNIQNEQRAIQQYIQRMKKGKERHDFVGQAKTLRNYERSKDGSTKRSLSKSPTAGSARMAQNRSATRLMNSRVQRTDLSNTSKRSGKFLATARSHGRLGGLPGGLPAGVPGGMPGGYQRVPPASANAFKQGLSKTQKFVNPWIRKSPAEVITVGGPVSAQQQYIPVASRILQNKQDQLAHGQHPQFAEMSLPMIVSSDNHQGQMMPMGMPSNPPRHQIQRSDSYDNDSSSAKNSQYGSSNNNPGSPSFQPMRFAGVQTQQFNGISRYGGGDHELPNEERQFAQTQAMAQVLHQQKALTPRGSQEPRIIIPNHFQQKRGTTDAIMAKTLQSKLKGSRSAKQVRAEGGRPISAMNKGRFPQNQQQAIHCQITARAAGGEAIIHTKAQAQKYNGLLQKNQWPAMQRQDLKSSKSPRAAAGAMQQPAQVHQPQMVSQLQSYELAGNNQLGASTERSRKSGGKGEVGVKSKLHDFIQSLDL